MLSRVLQEFNINEDSFFDTQQESTNIRIKELIKLYESPLSDIDIITESKQQFDQYVEEGVYGFYSPDDKKVHIKRKS